MSADEVSGVEFVDDDGELGDAEELPAPPSRLGPRVRMLLVLGAGLVLVVGLGARIGSSGGPVALPTSVLSGSVSAPVPVTAPAPTAPADHPELGPAGARGGTTDCPYASVCETAVTLPASVLAAVRASFPGARTVKAYSLQSHPRGGSVRALESREVTARAGNADILIQIRRFAPSDVVGSHVVEPGPGAIAVARRQGDYIVQVLESVPPGQVLTSRAAAVLADDSRVLDLR